MPALVEAWKASTERVTLLVLNTEGDSDELTKTDGFCRKIELEPRPEPTREPTYVNGAFVGGPPDDFEQFGMEYIPHLCVLSAGGVLLGHRVQAGEAMKIALAASSRV